MRLRRCAIKFVLSNSSTLVYQFPATFHPHSTPLEPRHYLNLNTTCSPPTPDSSPRPDNRVHQHHASFTVASAILVGCEYAGSVRSQARHSTNIFAPFVGCLLVALESKVLKVRLSSQHQRGRQVNGGIEFPSTRG